MAFEPWIGSATPTPNYTPYYVNTGLDNGTNTAGYWFVKTDEGDGGKSKVVWPVNVKTEADSLAPIIDFCKGVCGTADLDKGTLTYKPFVSVGFNVVGEDTEVKPAPGNAFSWGGICITYRSDVAPSLELSLGDYDATIEYALPAISLDKSINGESYKKCIPWSDFNQPSWYRGTKISGTEAAAQLVSINFKMQGSPGQYKFNICAIGPYGANLPTTCPKVLTMHPEISVNAKWSKGNDGYDATITVKDGEKELTEGTDYEIESNVNDATGIVIKTITGKGDYAGSVVKSLVPYIDENGEPQVMYDATVLTNNKDGVTELSGGWYVAMGKVNMAGIKFNGEAHLILADDAKMEIETESKYGINASKNLTIYGQNGQSGILNASATGTNGYGIYGNNGVTISGGTVTATGGMYGIYSEKNITINGDNVTVTSTYGDGVYSEKGNITISGGTVTASGNSSGINTNAGHITLGWTNSTDFIKVNSIHLGADSCTVSIAEGKSFKDEDGNVYSGTINPVSDIAGKTLVPSSFKGKFLSDVNIAVADIPVQKYADGKPVCPSVVVTDGKDTLNAGTDYTVVCSNNNAVTSATLDEAAVAQITGKGNYAGAIQKRFFIWNNICDYAAVQVFKDADGKTHAEIDGAYDGTDAVAIDEDVAVDTVTFSREFTPNSGFATIMFPFNVNASSLTGVRSIIEFAGVFDNNGKNAVGMKYVWCNAEQGKIEVDKGHPDCNEPSGELNAYTPYMVEMDTPTLGIDGGVTLVRWSEYDEDNKRVGDARKGNWVFRGALQKDEWSNEDVDIKNDQVWTFAASASNGTSIGKFVQLEGQNSVKPFQAYLYNLNGKQLAGTGELGSMDIVILADYIDYTAVQIFREANGNKHAVIDGSYGASADEPEAVSIPADIEVNSVEMTREFPTGSDNAFSTTVLPFDVNTANVSGLRAVLRYNGIKNGSTISMKVLWAEKGYIKNKDGSDKEYEHAQMAANTPYLVLMKNSEFKLKSEAYPITLKQTAPANTEIEGCDWVFLGTWKYKKWGSSCSTGKQDCDKETGFAYGFAASASEDNNISVGDFVKVGEGAWIRPMRAYLVRKDKLQTPQFARANGAYIKRPTVEPEELPELMSIVIDGDGDENETTVIGQFNTRTGEFKMNYDRGKFDLKGRRVNSEKPNARGAYYGKKVLKK